MTTNEAHMEISDETIKVAVDAFLAVPQLRNGDRYTSAMRAALLAIAPALTKAAVEAEREAWQTIETAPSGLPVLIFYKNRCNKGRIVKAFKCGKFENENTSEEGVEYAEYCEEKDSYFDPPGWYELIDNWDDYSYVFIDHVPTHWQPLPPPPVNAKGE